MANDRRADKSLGLEAVFEQLNHDISQVAGNVALESGGDFILQIFWGCHSKSHASAPICECANVCIQIWLCINIYICIYIYIYLFIFVFIYLFI